MFHIVTLSTKDNVKPLQKLKSGFRRTINWHRYQLKVSTEVQNQYLDFLINSSFQGLMIVLSFQNETD